MGGLLLRARQRSSRTALPKYNNSDERDASDEKDVDVVLNAHREVHAVAINYLHNHSPKPPLNKPTSFVPFSSSLLPSIACHSNIPSAQSPVNDLRSSCSTFTAPALLMARTNRIRRNPGLCVVGRRHVSPEYRKQHQGRIRCDVM